MLWKSFAIVLASFFLTGLTPHTRDIFDLIGLPIEVIGCAGVLAYAFHLRTSDTRLWAAFGWIFAAWSLVIIGVGMTRGVMQALPSYAIVFAIIFASAWLYPTWLALHRLGRNQRA